MKEESGITAKTWSEQVAALRESIGENNVPPCLESAVKKLISTARNASDVTGDFVHDGDAVGAYRAGMAAIKLARLCLDEIALAYMEHIETDAKWHREELAKIEAAGILTKFDFS